MLVNMTFILLCQIQKYNGDLPVWTEHDLILASENAIPVSGVELIELAKLWQAYVDADIVKNGESLVQSFLKFEWVINNPPSMQKLIELLRTPRDKHLSGLNRSIRIR